MQNDKTAPPKEHWHRRCGGSARALHRADHADRLDRRAVRDRPDVHGDGGPRAAARGQAVHAARAGGPRHLHPRGLLQLPLADDSPDARRGDALRRVEPRRRVRLRPPLPARLAPYRAGPAAGGRQVPRRLALRAHARSAQHQPGQHHAGLRLAAEGSPGRGGRARFGEGAAAGRRALQRRRGGRRARADRPAGRRDRREPEEHEHRDRARPRDHRPHRLPAAPGRGWQAGARRAGGSRARGAGRGRCAR